VAATSFSLFLIPAAHSAEPADKDAGKSGEIQQSFETPPVVRLPLGEEQKHFAEAQPAFEKANTGDWQEVFFDPGTDDWKDNWFLDGEVASVTNTPQGMQLTAGPQWGNGRHHMVLWTKKSLEGDLKIEFEYTRLDFENRGVNIIYIQATGSGEGEYKQDIAEWKALRTTPSMSTYFNNMHTYHISYAASPGTKYEYVRGRRYIPGGSGVEGLNDTDMKPDYFTGKLDVFTPGVPHKITIIKHAKALFMRVENPDGLHFFHWDNKGAPPITAGRIGLRQMFTRSARYKNFRVSKPE
jgi:hypothetical protein